MRDGYSGRTAVWRAVVVGGLWLASLCGRMQAAETNLLAEFAVRRWSIEDGLPESVINSIDQFSDGYLWCTTPHHLVRFDGVHFSEGEFDGAAVAQQGVLRGAYRDSQGLLWCYGSGGAWRDSQPGWVLIPMAEGTSRKPDVLQMQEGPDHTLWAATSAGVFQFDGQAFQPIVIPGMAGEPAVSLVGVDLGAKGGFWLVSGRALLHFQQGTYGTVTLPPEVAASSVKRVACGKSGALWLVAANQLFCRRGGTWTALPLPLPGDKGELQVTAMREGDDGALWLGCLYGIYRWQNEQWRGFTARDGIFFPLDVRSLACDREGDIWAGTSSGLVRLRRSPVRVFRTGVPWGGESITALLADSPTNFWTAVAGGGLLRGTPEAFHLVRMGALPEGATVSALLRGRDKTLWIGTQGESLWRCREDGTVDKIEQAAGANLSARGISALLEDRRGRLWVGTWDGLMTLNDEGKLAPVLFQGGPQGPVHPPADTVHVLCEDSAGRIWAGYQSLGLVCFDPDGRSQSYQQSAGLPGDSIRSLCVGASNTLWIGTTQGLAMWQGNEHHFFTTKNGLVDNVILQIVEERSGALWLGTAHGFMRIRRDEFDKVVANRKLTLAIRLLDTEFGMGEDECIGGLGVVAAQTTDGRIWFPTMEGIVMVDPQRMPAQLANPRAYVEEVDANNQRCYALSLENIASTNEPVQLRLKHGSRDIEFHYTAPMFFSPDRVYFRYFLEGFDHAWSHAVNDRVARYPRLPAGEYRFQVKARDQDGAWSEITPAIVVRIRPYFWQTIWFWAGIALISLATVGLGVQAYDRRKTARQLLALEARHAVERERARIARDIHDDVGAGLTEVAMLSELAQDEGANPHQLHDHLDSIFRRARQLTQSLDEIVWAINPANDTADSFISYIGEFAQDFLGAAGVACRLDLPRDPPPVNLGSHVRHHLWLAIKESLHNIVKHAGASEVQLQIKLQGRDLSVSIADDGRGFVTGEMTGNGQDGLRNLRDRLREIDGDLQHESRPGSGTRLVLSVKLPTAVRRPDQVT